MRESVDKTWASSFFFIPTVPFFLRCFEPRDNKLRLLVVPVGGGAEFFFFILLSTNNDDALHFTLKEEVTVRRVLLLLLLLLLLLCVADGAAVETEEAVVGSESSAVRRERWSCLRNFSFFWDSKYRRLLIGVKVYGTKKSAWAGYLLLGENWGVRHCYCYDGCYCGGRRRIWASSDS